MSSNQEFAALSDEKLIELVKQGDAKATDVLLNRYKNLVRSKAHGFFLIGGETEDLIQEGMCGLYDAMIAYDPQKSGFRSFASLCITRKIVDAVKLASGKKYAPLNGYISMDEGECEELLSQISPEETMIRAEDKAEFLKKMHRALSDFEYRIIRMYIDGMSLSGIAEAVARPVKSVDNALQRAKKKLKVIFYDKE